jgi:ATPase subunit of ABC transporter with duplicated ATPase domains
MKQRLRLAFAFFTQSSMILLDEPTVMLDQSGVEWYQSLLRNFSGDRTVVIASNLQSDLETCTARTIL